MQMVTPEPYESYTPPLIKVTPGGGTPLAGPPLHTVTAYPSRGRGKAKQPVLAAQHCCGPQAPAQQHAVKMVNGHMPAGPYLAEPLDPVLATIFKMFEDETAVVAQVPQSEEHTYGGLLDNGMGCMQLWHPPVEARAPAKDAAE